MDLRAQHRILHCRLRKDASGKEIDNYIEHLDVGWLDSILMKFTFRCMLIPRAYTAEQIQALASRSKFGKCNLANGPIGFEISLNKP